MESKIISEEILRLHMVEESDKLLSLIRSGEISNELFLVNIMVRIYRYETDKSWGSRQLIYENAGFKVERFMRWKWFFRYLQAKEQIKTPRQLIQIECISYVNPDRDKVLIKVLTNKLIAAKRDKTKALFSIEKGKKLKKSTSLFSYEDDPDYLKALEYLSGKEKLIAEIEAEIAQLNKH